MSRAAIFSALIVMALLAGCGETPEVYYPKYSDAISDGAVARGWIPVWLPKSATEINEIHNLDTNRSMLAFRFNGAENMELKGECEGIEPTRAKEPTFHVPWWPRDVLAKKPPYRHGFFACEDGKAFLAISKEPGKAFYWRP